MISESGGKLYTESLKLKRYSSSDILRKTKRSELLGELKDVQLCVDQLLEELYKSSNFSLDYFKVALVMYDALFECVLSLSSKGSRYRENVCKCIHGFHNLPRAFLSLENPSHISAEDALNYYGSYFAE